MKSYVEVFIDPVTGQGTGGEDLDSLAKFIIQTATEELPHAQSLDELKNGIMYKGDYGEISTREKISIEELPPLGGAVIKGVFRGNVWRGAKNGKVEESDALSNCVVDLGLINTKLLIANFVMGSSLVPAVWQGATFLDKIPNGILWNCAGERHDTRVLRRANPGIDYMQPDLSANHIWMGVDDPGYDPETKAVKAPWVDAPYITQRPVESSPNSQALSDLNVGLYDAGILSANGHGVVEVAKLNHNCIWIGNEKGMPEKQPLELADKAARYIVQRPNNTLPNAQALDRLHVAAAGSILKSLRDGTIEVAIAGEDYATAEQLEELTERAETAATESEASAEEATASALEATTAATEATVMAGEATTSASASAVSAGGAIASAAAASLSAVSSASSSSDSSRYALMADKSLQTLLGTELEFRGDIEGSGILDKPIVTKIKANPVFQGSCITLAGGLNADRPTNPVAGMLRYISHEESSVVKLEFYNGEEWKEIV